MEIDRDRHEAQRAIDQIARDLEDPESRYMGSYLGLARVAMELAEKDAREINQIDRDLEAGRDSEALEGMRKFLRDRGDEQEVRKSIAGKPSPRSRSAARELDASDLDMGSYVGLARATMELAEKDIRELDRIASDLKAGRDSRALDGMRKFLRYRKPINKEQEVIATMQADRDRGDERPKEQEDGATLQANCDPGDEWSFQA